MLRILGCVGAILSPLLGGMICLTVVVITPLIMPSFQGSQQSNGGSWTAPGHLASVVAAAETLQHHVFGSLANQYDLSDPVIQRVSQYWFASCGRHGQICEQARSGNLQCVLFVTGAFYLGGNPLPAVGNAQDFWWLYQNRAGWKQIYATAFPPAQRGLPAPGDLMVWQGGRHLEQGRMVEYGHIAVVVRVVPPKDGHHGSITVAQANAPGNHLRQSERPGNFYTLSLFPDLHVNGWSPFTTAQGVSYGNSTVLGYLRQQAPVSLHLPTEVPKTQPYVTPAVQAALTAGINAVSFVRQIQRESGFNPRAISPAGAQGIAQLMPGTARGLGVDPWDPPAALKAAAQLMAQYHQRYDGDDAKALAAYNAGPGALEQAIQRCGDRWLWCVSPETRQYVLSH